MHLLAAGHQKDAEHKLLDLFLLDPKNPDYSFWLAALSRSRFDVRAAAPGFADTMKNRPDSPEGLASACVLGIDLSRNRASAMYYFNALLTVCGQNPNSIPIHWLAAVMARTLTRDLELSPEIRKRVMLCGVREYETVLSLMAPGPGPALIHQTMANLLDDLDGPDLALKHREIALRLERAPWSLQGAAATLLRLNRSVEAESLMQEVVAKGGALARDYHTLGKALWNLGRTEEAMAAWDRMCKLAPGNPDYLKIGVLHARDLGNYEAARAYARAAPEDRFLKVWAARFDALLGEPAASERVEEAGSLDFNGQPVNEKLPEDLWFRAVQTGDLKKIQQLAGSMNVNALSPEDHQTALMIAARCGWDMMAAELIKAGANLDEVDANGDTALHYSAQFGNLRVMKLLLEAGASTDRQDKWNQTPLIMCPGHSEFAGLAMLLEHHANPNVVSFWAGTALHYAAGHGSLSMINALLKHGANINLADKTGATPLIVACSSTVVRWQESPHSVAILPLLAAGADLNTRDKGGCTALHNAVEPLLNIPLVELLLEKGADPTVADKDGVTPIAKARLLGFEEIAKILEKKAGRPEKFHFPQFATPDAGFSAEEQKGCFFVMPILLAQGNPLGRPSGLPRDDRKEAVRELRRLFGIQNAADLKEEIAALEAFEPSHRDDVMDFRLGLTSEQARERLKSAVRNIHASCDRESSDETAFTKSHIIYLADLGVSAGFLTRKEGDTLMTAASRVLSQNFSSWPPFLKSFLLGVRFHDGSEADRYQHICQRIVESGPRWPGTGHGQ